jgi:SAM-dependent methyltransferase
MDDQESRDHILKMALRESYSRLARNSGTCCTSGCCGSAEHISGTIGYTREQMAEVPPGANLGLGCGNSVASASLKEGETVLDLGSAAGFDCFLASKAVGPRGRVIGVDMTEEMLDRARGNAQKGDYGNVEFRLGEIESLPVEDESVDVIISNCVINLVPDKKKAFQEAFRVLRPAGRLMVSDIVVNKPLPIFVSKSIKAHVGCLSGAVPREKYLQAIRFAGFEEVQVIEESEFPLDCMVADPHGQAILKGLDESSEDVRQLEGCISSLKVSARKPGRG